METKPTRKRESKDQQAEPLWRPSLYSSLLRPLGWTLKDIWQAVVNNFLLFLEEALERQRMRTAGETPACLRWVAVRQPSQTTSWQARRNGRRG